MREVVNKFSKYLTYSDSDMKLPVYCCDVGYTEIPPEADYPPCPQEHPQKYRQTKGRILNEYQIVFITKGNGTFKNRQEQYPVKPGTVFILFPGEWHWYSPDIETGWHEYWVGFKGDLPDGLIRNGFLKIDQPIHNMGYSDSLINIYMEIFDLARTESPGYQMRIGALVYLMFVEINGGMQKERPTDNEKIIQRVKFIFNENLYKELNMTSLSADIGVSYKLFKQLFMEYTGLSPYQYFLHLKINKAKELLQSGQHSVKDVAYTLAFTNQYYFSRLFKKKTGSVPSHWFNNFDKNREK
jgi:AraC-like DNA-binding protein